MESEQRTVEKSPIEAAIESARTLLHESKYLESLTVAEAVAVTAPNNRDAIYLIAVNQRYLGRLEDALATLTRLEICDAGYGRLYQERGHCYRAMPDRSSDSIIAYERAVESNPALVASWKALAELYRAAGRSADVERAADRIRHFERLPRELVSVTSLINEGQLYLAERMCRRFLQTRGHHLEGMRLLARIGVELDVLDDAEFLLESVLEFAPEHRLARYEYARVLSLRQKYAKALEQAKILKDLEPDNLAFEGLYAAQCAGIGDHVSSIEAYKGLLRHAPDDPMLHLSLGHALRTLGSQPEAIAAYRDAIRVKPDFGDGYWSLANLKTYRFTPAELQQMREQEALPTTSTPDRYHLCFALGKGLEDRGQYAESFDWYARGNALKMLEERYSADRMDRDLRLQQDVCTAEFFAARAGVGSSRSDPIFIVGLPRAGSTLLEQILASHSRVEGTMELPNIRALANRIDGRRRIDEEPRYPAAMTEIDPARFADFGERYLQETQVYRSGKPIFIDKNPNNFRHIGLIHLILPNAKIIDARRDAMACCFSCFKQLFASGQEFTYGLEEIGRYYRGYIELMAHWDRVLPGKVLRVQYEDVVSDVEASVHRILEFCGLEFEPACVEFYRTQRSVRTASSEQVRRPINREGLEQWKPYAEWLGPLREALGPLVQVGL